MTRTNRHTNRNEFAYDVWAADYDEQIPPHAVLDLAPIKEMISPQKSDRILDLACGTGRLAKVWHQAGALVTGVDISQKMLERARAKVPEALFIQVDLNGPLPFSNEQFDKVSSSLALKHIQRLDALFFEIYRVTKPGARFVSSTIHPMMDWSTYERSAPSTIDINEEGDTYPYTTDEICKQAELAGWSVLGTSDIYSDESIRPYLSAHSFEKQRGLLYVWILALEKPKAHQ